MIGGLFVFVRSAMSAETAWYRRRVNRESRVLARAGALCLALVGCHAQSRLEHPTHATTSRLPTSGESGQTVVVTLGTVQPAAAVEESAPLPLQLGGGILEVAGLGPALNEPRVGDFQSVPLVQVEHEGDVAYLVAIDTDIPITRNVQAEPEACVAMA